MSIPRLRENRGSIRYVRTYLTNEPAIDDSDVLDDLRRDGEAPKRAFSLYLAGKTHHRAITTITEEGDLALGLELDDPESAPETVREEAAIMAHLREEFSAIAGVGGVELARHSR